MSENTIGQMKNKVEKHEFEDFTVEVFSAGKIKLDPAKNEDCFFVSPTILAVIDGSTSKVNASFNGMTSGKYAGNLVVEALKKAGPGLTNRALVGFISDYLAETFERDGFGPAITTEPEARPTAVAAIARIKDGKLSIVQIGDVGFRINGEDLQPNELAIDIVMAKKRIDTIEDLKSQHPEMSEEEILRLGREAILRDLKRQVLDQQNSPNDPLGYGAFDGREIPEKHIKSSDFDLDGIETLEIFTDGYFKLADEPTIQSWEEAFEYVEKADPGKIKDFPSTKGSSPTTYTDDRTVLIFKRKI